MVRPLAQVGIVIWAAALGVAGNDRPLPQDIEVVDALPGYYRWVQGLRGLQDGTFLIVDAPSHRLLHVDKKGASCGRPGESARSQARCGFRATFRLPLTATPACWIPTISGSRHST